MKRFKKQNAKLVEFNEKLTELNECKNKLLRIAAHELRNPLYVIQSYSDILKDSSLKIPDENKQKYLEKIFNSSEQMRNLLDNLLDFSTIESGELHLNKSSQCLNSIVANQVELHQLLAKKKDIQLMFSPENIPPLMLDKNAMIQAIGNFIGNAIKFSPHGRLVKISTECEEGVVRFSVNDEGPGLTEEELKLAFTEFQTLTAKPTGGEKSTGLGLSIVKKIIILHGGEVGVTSGAGKGANFYFTVPL